MNGYGDKKFPWNIEDVEPEVDDELKKYFANQQNGFVRVGPKGFFFDNKYKDEAHLYYNMEVRPSDVFLTSFPRSGTTWSQHMTWLLANDLDYAKADEVTIVERFPCLEFSSIFPDMAYEKLYKKNKDNPENLRLLNFMAKGIVESFEKTTSRRFIQTHLPLSVLPPSMLDTAKVIYVARDPRDVAVSYYHLNRLLESWSYTGDFKRFWDYFRKGMVTYAPYFEHVKEFWEKRNHPNLLFLFYEDLKKNLAATVRRVSEFLGKQYTEQQIAELCEHLSFENFKNNKSVNGSEMKAVGYSRDGEQSFIRKGKSGGWKDNFDEEMALQAERWIVENLQGTDLRYPGMDINI